MKLPNSTSKDILPGINEEKLLKEARKHIESAFPNPDRFGCPNQDRLKALARQRRIKGDDLNELEHIASCSSCFCEYHVTRKEWKRSRSIVTVGLLAASVSAIAICVLLYSYRPVVMPDSNVQVLPKMAEIPVQTAVVDLRRYSVTRGENLKQNRPVVLSRARLQLTIQLAVGSEEGRYSFELRDSRGEVRIEATGSATIRNYVTTVNTEFDMRDLSAGRFTLAVRRSAGLTWKLYPVEIR